MKCAVIILNWNGEKMLRQFLPSVVQHTPASQPPNISTSQLPNLQTQVIVADNGSTDNSLQILREEFPTVEVINLKHNYGFAEGYNRAIQQVDAEYVVLLNSDVEVTDNWLNPILTYLDAHPDVAAAQPKILKWTNSLTHVCEFEHAGAAGGFIDCLGYPFCRGRIMDYVEEDQGQYDSILDIFWASGACLVIRKDTYIQAGGLDADFFAHMEEIDLCWRLNARGHRLVCIPESKVYHLGGGSLPYNNPRKTFLNFRNNLLMICKNAPAKILYPILFIRFVMDYAAALMYLLKGDTEQFKAVLKARYDYHKLIPNFKQKRKENIQKAINPTPKTIIRRSIIWDFYIRGMRK